jgi:hypothetical protein
MENASDVVTIRHYVVMVYVHVATMLYMERNKVKRKWKMSADKCPICGSNLRQYGYTVVCENECGYQIDI